MPATSPPPPPPSSLSEQPQLWLVNGKSSASHRLVPGDVVVLQPGKATCEMVLLHNKCVVDKFLKRMQQKQMLV